MSLCFAQLLIMHDLHLLIAAMCISRSAASPAWMHAEQAVCLCAAYMTKNKKTLFARCVLSVPEQFQPLVYMGIHVFLCFLATLTAKFWWESKTAHTGFLILCASGSAWNGGEAAWLRA